MPDGKIKTDSITSPAAALTGETAIAPAAEPAKKSWLGLLSAKKISSQPWDVFKAIKYIYPLTIFLIVLILIWVMYFLYNNVYLTMSQAELVSSLKSKVIEENVDFNKFNAIAERVTEKKALSGWRYADYLSSPFGYAARTAYPGAVPATSAASSTPIYSTSTAAASSSTKPAANSTSSAIKKPASTSASRL